MIAALFVEKDGRYSRIPDVDLWDASRNALNYRGPHPVVAHPPCQRWGKMWAGNPSWIARTGKRKRKGADGGCFAFALSAVREFGGVLEHPWRSHAWPAFGLNVPPRTGGWIRADFNGGWTCCIEQGRYGHVGKKPTLLYAVRCILPELAWGKSEPKIPQWAIDRYGEARARRMGELALQTGGGKNSKVRISTPPAFQEILLNMARSVQEYEL